MKKMKVVSLFLIVFFSFFAFLDGVKAGTSDYQCNIAYGKSGHIKSKGYGNFYGEENASAASEPSIHQVNIDSSDCKALSFWCTKVAQDITLDPGKNNSITWYKMIFYDDNDRELCAIGSNYGSPLPKSGNYVKYSFDFENGHISYIKVAFDYKNSSGKEVNFNNGKYSKINIYKRIGNSSKVNNIYIGGKTTTAPFITSPTPKNEGWYLCKKTKEEMKTKKSDSLSPLNAGKICIYTNAFSDLSKRTCNKKQYKSEQACKKALSNTDITTTTTTTTTAMTSYGELGTAGSGDINQASKAKLNASDVTYDPSKGHMDCEDLSVKDLIDEYWSIVMVLVPIVLMLLMSIDFIKALTANDQEQLKKSGNSAIKRTIAAVILLMLPALLSMILGWVGLELCI